MLDSKQHLNDAYYGIIGDISREIDSGTGVFSASLRKRCKAANLTIGRETQRLESVMHKQLKVFYPTGLCDIYTYLYVCCAGLCLTLTLSVTVAPLFFSVSEELSIRVLCLVYLLGFLAYQGTQANAYLSDIVTHIYRLRRGTLRCVWAWRDMSGLFALIAESEGRQLSDIPHAQRFLKAFEVSFAGVEVELWKTRSKVQTLSKFAKKIRAMKDQDAYDAATVLSTACPWYHNSVLDAFRLGRAILVSLYTKVSHLVFRESL
ncbi:uncharacterized protein EV420DRAFT_1164442 [Desarmillaria tabescens]|uniref:Uncharacterized protein n=1 Tax=Armillaria tabescens TaxID=1929756 RepID=A0AA39TQS9_ARMTA|nr:uncharacterized protein EV420DRAFT_1164442 [Desarmillaria tabescens]KAK0463273.1 hypothetical protein EV420DRAFT_1164442 [Desarmillaria tabescens]